jgi:hypothetical protein
MTPVPPSRRAVVPLGAATPHEEFAQLLDRQDYSPRAIDETDDLKQNGYLYVYPYAVSRHQLEQAIRLLSLPVILTKELDTADAVLALRTHLKNHTKLRHLAKTRQLPIYILKSNSTAHIARTLRRILKLDDEGGEVEPVDLRLFADNASDDELEALEEARLAVENIVIPKGQPVELLPRSAHVRKMQHELIEHYKLTSTSFGEEPNRRLRIFPA